MSSCFEDCVGDREAEPGSPREQVQGEILAGLWVRATNDNLVAVAVQAQNQLDISIRSTNHVWAGSRKLW
jgi:hypothetical protein